jgi:protocatechuate 3,4-dioxygenase beta subunit
MSFNKGEVTMRNYIKILLLIMVLAISGCGSGATSADPLGTDTISVSPLTISLGAGESSVITAKVLHAGGAVATLRSVRFEITTTTGGSIDVSEKDIDGNGVATVIYTAGTGASTTSATDKVTASITNGQYATVIITRTGSATLPTSAVLTLTPGTLAPISAGKNTTITANVTDSAGVPLSGVTVTFTIPVKNSGTPTLSVASAVTDSSGSAFTIYSPGTASGGADVVQASLPNNSTKLVTITVTTAVAPPANVISALIPSILTPLTAGQTPAITATVNNAGAAVSGVTVTFSIPVKSSGAPILSTLTAVTGVDGKATTYYIPGTASPTMSVDDIVQASLANGETKLVTITRSGSATATNNVISALTAANVTSATPLRVGQNSIVTATVTDTAGDPVSGETVKFSLPVKGSGLPTLIPAPIAPAITTDVKTDTNGVAIAIYTPGVGSPTASVEDAVQATLTNGTGLAVIITRSGNVSPATNYVTLSESPAGGVGAANASGVITATVTNVSGNPVSGVTVTFSIAVWSSSGVYPAANPAYPVGPTLSNLTGITDGNGKAITIYTSGATAGMTDVIRAVITDGDAAIVVTD